MLSTCPFFSTPQRTIQRITTMIQVDQSLVLSAAVIYQNIPTSFSKFFSKADALELAGVSMKRAQHVEYRRAINACLHYKMNLCNCTKDRFELLWPKIKVFLFAKTKTIAGVMILAGFAKNEVKQGPQYERCRRWVNSQKKKNMDNADKFSCKPRHQLLRLSSSQVRKSAPIPAVLQIPETKDDYNNLVSPLPCVPAAVSWLDGVSAQVSAENHRKAMQTLALELGTLLLGEVQKMEICPPQLRTSADIANQLNQLFGVDLLRA